MTIEPNQLVADHVAKHQTEIRETVAKAYAALDALFEIASAMCDSKGIYRSPEDLIDEEATARLFRALGYDHLEAVFETLPHLTLTALHGTPMKGEVLTNDEALERRWMAEGRCHDVWAHTDATPEHMVELFQRFAHLQGWWDAPVVVRSEPVPYRLHGHTPIDDVSR